MNVLEEVIIKSPNDIDEKCGKFIINDTITPYILYSITNIGRPYIFSAWIKANTSGSITINGNTINITTEWLKYEISFSATSKNLSIFFDVPATYYFYHSKLEIKQQTGHLLQKKL